MEIEDESKDKSEQNGDNESIENEDEDNFERKNEFDDLMNINSDKYKNMEKINIKENNIIKNEIIDIYKKKLDKIITNKEYLKYLNNEKYKCEFCGEKYNHYDNNERIYKCCKNDITFSCCLTSMPINNNFLWCSYCTLFYSCEINLFYCIVCDRILNKLDSL